MAYRVFSLTWPVSMQIYWNFRKRLHKKGVQLFNTLLSNELMMSCNVEFLSNRTILVIANKPSERRRSDGEAAAE